MSSADYACDCLDHARILISVESGGSIGDSEFDEALAVLNQHQVLHIADAGRNIHFKFQKNHNGADDWGSFQLHRRPLGLVILAECSTAIDVALLHEVYQKKKQQRSDTIYDSRCFIFGIDNALLQQSKDGMFQYLSIQDWKSSEKDIKEFLTSLFYVLESKRRLFASEKADRVPMLWLPFENRSSSTPPERKKSQGRWRKHLGDISLLCGMYAEALDLYQSAGDALYASNDNIYMAAAIEGLCVTSSIVIWPENPQAITPIPKVKAPESISMQKLDARNLISSSSRNSTSAVLTLNELIKMCLQTSEEFIGRYKEAVIIYSKEKNLGVVELESCIKATKTMAIMKKYKQASEFLQNAVYINLKVPDSERVARYSSLSDLYAKIGMKRKSSFYSRVAAMQCVSTNLESHQWQTRSLPGFGVAMFTDSGFPLPDGGQNEGWALIKLRILHELAYASRKLGDERSAARIMIYALTRLHAQMNEAEEKDICKFLESLTVSHPSQSTSNTAQILDILNVKAYDGTSLPPINFYSIPTLKYIEVLPLKETEKPHIIKKDDSQNGVFLFTPSSYFRPNDRSNKIAFKWVVDEEATLEMIFFNPLKHSAVKVRNLQLMGEMTNCEGELPLSCHLLTFELEPQATVTKYLRVIPRQAGLLTITGYRTLVYGIESCCRFKHMSWITEEKMEIEVTPPLPLIQRKRMKTSLNIEDEKKREYVKTSLFPGETKSVRIPLVNIGNISTRFIDVSTTTHKQVGGSGKHDDKLLHIKCSDINNLTQLLPTHETYYQIQLTADYQSFHYTEARHLVTDVEMKITSDLALVENCCRHFVFGLETTIRPHLTINHVQVSHTEKQGWCRLVMTFENKSNEEIRVISTTLGRDDVILSDDDQFEDDKLLMVVLDPQEISTSSHVIRCTEQVMRNEEGEEDKMKQLVQLLDQLLLLEWRISTKEHLRSGRLDLCSLEPSNTSMLTNLLKPPMKWNVDVDSNDATETCKYETTTGKCCTLRYLITNVSRDKIGKMEVELEVFQDQENGMCEYNMEDSILIIGTTSADFDHVSSGECCEFICSILFLLVGDYQVRARRVDEMIKCADGDDDIVDEQSYNFSPVLTVTVNNNDNDY